MSPWHMGNCLCERHPPNVLVPAYNGGIVLTLYVLISPGAETEKEPNQEETTCQRAAKRLGSSFL